MSEPLPPQSDLVRLFAEIAPRFGLSRPAGQCLAAIWRAAQAPSAEMLTEELGLSRTNVSVALKELRGAGLVRAARSPGSRRDYFVAEADPWALLRALLTERHRRDIAPVADSLARLDSPDPRIAPLAAMVTQAAEWFGQLAQLAPEELARTLAAAPEGRKKKKKRDKD